MKLAVSSPNFSLIKFELMLEKISTGFRAWEIVAEGEHYLWDIKQKIISLLPSYNLELFVHAPLSDVNIASLNPKMRSLALQQISATIKIASELDLKLVTLHPGYYSPLGVLAKPKVKALCKESIKQLGKLGKEHGIKIALENMPKQYFTLCWTLKELVELANNEVELCFDVGHANTTNEIDNFLNHPSEFADVHLHDNFGSKDEHLPLGKGNIDFRRVLAKLAGYKGYFVIESRSLEEALESKKYIEKLSY